MSMAINNKFWACPKISTLACEKAPLIGIQKQTKSKFLLLSLTFSGNDTRLSTFGSIVGRGLGGCQVPGPCTKLTSLALAWSGPWATHWCSRAFFVDSFVSPYWVGFILGFKTKRNFKFEWFYWLREKNKHKIEPKDYKLEYESMIRETWIGTTMAPLACQSLLVPTQENAPSNMRKRT